MEGLEFRSAVDLAAGYRDGGPDAVDVVIASLKRIDEYDGAIGAFVHVDSERAVAQAVRSRNRATQGRLLGPLDGVPVSVKENVAVKGWPVGVGSLAVPSTIAAANAPLVDRLEEAGALLVGTTRMPDHGWKGVTSGPAGLTRNPWNRDNTPGGSSGGAAAGLAAGMVPLAVGSDGGGSIRIPATFCGVVGLKATFGRVAALARGSFGTLSHFGPMARTVDDVGLLLDVIGRPDPRDPPSQTAAVEEPVVVHGLRVLVWSQPEGGTIEPAVGAGLDRAAAALDALGARVEPGTLPLKGALEAFLTIWQSGLARIVSNLPPKRQALLDEGMLEMAEEGLAISAVDYVRAQQQRAVVAERMADLHKLVDIVLSPVNTVTSIPIGLEVPPGSDFTRWYQWAPFAYPFNLTGAPALALPVGVGLDGSPTGVQLAGPRHRDASLLAVGRSLEQRLGGFREHSDAGDLLRLTAGSTDRPGTKNPALP